MGSNVKHSFEEFLNPKDLRPRLILASIYIGIFEALKDAVVGGIRDFFCSGFDYSGDKVAPKYASDVLIRHRSPPYASINWLKSMGAISDADVEVFNCVKAFRNTLAHDLLSTLSKQGLPDDFDEHFTVTVALLRKIEVCGASCTLRSLRIPTTMGRMWMKMGSFRVESSPFSFSAILRLVMKSKVRPTTTSSANRVGVANNVGHLSCHDRFIQTPDHEV